MSDAKLNAAFLAELGSSNRDRLLAAPDRGDASLRGRVRPNGPGRVASQQLNGSSDATISGWQAFATHNKDNVSEGDLADLHGGQLHRLNREAKGYGSSGPTPANFHHQPRPHFNQPQDRTPSSFYDNPRSRIQPQARAQPSTNGVGHGDPNDPLELARQMQFTGSYSGKTRGGGMRGSPSNRGGYGGTDFRGGRGGYESRGGRGGRGGYSLQDCRSSDIGGSRGSSLGRGRVYPTPPTRGGPVGGQYPRGYSTRGRGEPAIRSTTPRRPQPREGRLISPEDDTKRSNGPAQINRPKDPPQKPTLVSSEDFMKSIMGSKWNPN